MIKLKTLLESSTMVPIPRFLYHFSPSKNEDSILKKGLRINSPDGFTIRTDVVKSIYGMLPNFVATEEWANHFLQSVGNGIIFKIDMRGLKCTADIPLFIDKFSKLIKIKNELYLKFPDEISSHFKTLNTYPNKNGMTYIPIKDFSNNKGLTSDFFQLTKTVAIEQDVPPDRIKVFKKV